MSRDSPSYTELWKRCETYRRRVGGTEAALRRERQKSSDLEALVRDMHAALEVYEGKWADEGEYTALASLECRMEKLGVVL